MLDVIVADNHDGVRKMICGLLRSDPAIRVRGECADGRNAIALAAATQPDVALLDLTMRDLHGFEVAARIQVVAPDTRIIILTAHDVSSVRSSMSEAALYEIIDKTCIFEHLLSTVWAVGSTRLRRMQRRLTDAERCLALRSYRVLHTPPEQTYDDITTIAAQRTQCAISVVSLIDSDHQWFKARYGCNELGTPRELSFCTHTIETPDKLLVIPDARLDPRFSSNPLVAGPHSLRFYAGAPLVNSAGAVLGTLCVLDREPHKITEGQGNALRRLAERVMTTLELRKSPAYLPV